MCRVVGRMARGGRVAMSRITELVSSMHLALRRISCGRVKLLMPSHFGGNYEDCFLFRRCTITITLTAYTIFIE